MRGQYTTIRYDEVLRTGIMVYRSPLVLLACCCGGERREGQGSSNTQAAAAATADTFRGGEAVRMMIIM